MLLHTYGKTVLYLKTRAKIELRMCLVVFAERLEQRVWSNYMMTCVEKNENLVFGFVIIQMFIQNL